MKVLFWTNGFWPRIGGIETQGLKFIESMQERGHQYIVIANKDDPSWKEEEEYRGITIKRFDFDDVPVKKNLILIRQMNVFFESLLRDFQPDIIHLNACMGWEVVVFLLLKSIFRTPIVLTMHAPIIFEGKLGATTIRAISIADQVCCVSKWVYHQMEKLVPSYQSKLRLNYNGLPMPEMEPSSLSFSPPTLLLLGRLSPEKGFDTAITAFSLLKKSGSNARLIIAGEGAERQLLEKLVDQLHLRDFVTFTGKLDLDQVPSIINQATIVIVPSYFESFGLVALEAMQMQRPVIASKVGGLPEIVSHLETGLIVPPKDPAALFTAMKVLLDDPDQAKRMGLQGRERALEKFTLQRNAVQYEEIYEELVKTPALQGRVR